LDSTTWTTYTDDTIDYAATTPRYRVGSSASNGARLNGCLSELWFDDQYLDLSVQANREKFRTAAGKPKNLGSDGSTPTGTAPSHYFKSASPNAEVNDGTGEDFVEGAEGAIAACSTSPSD